MLWLVLALMTAAAMFAVLWPLARSRRVDGNASDVVIYRDQLHEIERDRASGTIGTAEADAARDALAPDGKVRGRLRIAAPLSFGPTHFAPVFAELAGRHPELELQTSYSDHRVDLVAEGFDERDPAVKVMLEMAIRACRKQGKYVGICGQGPSDHPDLARWLMEQGIDSLSLNPDTVVSTWMALAEAPPPTSDQKKSAAA